MLPPLTLLFPLLAHAGETFRDNTPQPDVAARVVEQGAYSQTDNGPFRTQGIGTAPATSNTFRTNGIEAPAQPRSDTFRNPDDSSAPYGAPQPVIKQND